MINSSRPQHVSSRLARHEQKKAMRQTIIYLGTAVILILAFIFVIMPGFLRFAASISGESDGFEVSDSIPPQVPFIAAPPQATSSASITITGYGEPESEIVYVVNGSELERGKIESDGTFTQDIELIEGENTITAFSIDASKNESDVGRVYSVVMDDTDPVIEISEPQPDQSFELRANQVITIKGKTEPNARVMINGRLAFANAEGEFSSTYQLQEGDNKLTIEAEDAAGNKSQTELTVKFRL
jgi:uncharacterized protein YfaP (DUF2135 family)